MKEKILKLFWEMSKSTYPSGTSTHTNAILEQDYEALIEEIVNIKPGVSNCYDRADMEYAYYADKDWQPFDKFIEEYDAPI